MSRDIVLFGWSLVVSCMPFSAGGSGRWPLFVPSMFGSLLVNILVVRVFAPASSVGRLLYCPDDLDKTTPSASTRQNV